MKHMKIMVRIHPRRPRGQIDGLEQAETGAKKKSFIFCAYFCWSLFRCTSHKIKGCMLLGKLKNNKKIIVVFSYNTSTQASLLVSTEQEFHPHTRKLS